MFGPREIDSVAASHIPACFSIVGDANRPGAIREFAQCIATEQPEFFAIHGIDAGDALALATRFDRGWAYRGRQALFWRGDTFNAHEVYDRYLPSAPLRPFDRRGLLEVRGDYGGEPLALIAAQLAADRSRIRELRFVRGELRRISGRTLLFLAGHYESARIGFRDLGFLRVRSMHDCGIYTRA